MLSFKTASTISTSIVYFNLYNHLSLNLEFTLIRVTHRKFTRLNCPNLTMSLPFLHSLHWPKIPKRSHFKVTYVHTANSITSPSMHDLFTIQPTLLYSYVSPSHPLVTTLLRFSNWTIFHIAPQLECFLS